MEKITKENIQNWANKLMFRLDDSQLETLEDEFEVIVEEMELINKIEGIEDVEPMTFPYKPDYTELRNDDYEDSEDVEDLLSNAKDISGREIKVPKVVE